MLTIIPNNVCWCVPMCLMTPIPITPQEFVWINVILGHLDTKLLSTVCKIVGGLTMETQLLELAFNTALKDILLTMLLLYARQPALPIHMLTQSPTDVWCNVQLCTNTSITTATGLACRLALQVFTQTQICRNACRYATHQTGCTHTVQQTSVCGSVLFPTADMLQIKPAC